MEGKITSADVWVILDVKAGQRNPDQNRRMGDAMRKLNWQRPNTAGTIVVEGQKVMGWVRGQKDEQKLELVKVCRNRDGLYVGAKACEAKADDAQQMEEIPF